MSLLKYQIPHVNKMIRSLHIYNIAVDASDTGTGKTYCALSIAKMLNLKPLIICPKSVLTNWNRVATELDIEPLIITNYDIIISKMSKKKQEALLKTVDNKSHLYYCYKKYVRINDKKKEEEYDEDEDEDEDDDKEQKQTDDQTGVYVCETFEWKIPENTLIIFDEVHRCKSDKSLHYKLLISIKNYLTSNIKCLLLSATIADKPRSFKSIAYLLDWITNPKSFNVWLKAATAISGETQTKTINRTLFRTHGSRIKITKLGDLFPQNSIQPECYDMDNAVEIEKEYENIKTVINELREKKNKSNNILTQIIRSRQIIELLKIPSFCELINNHLENNYSVVIFVNFTETLNRLATFFKTKSVIHGNQNIKERTKIIDDFQANKTKLIIANIETGGVGISLHDIHGNHPRVSIISPSWSAQNTIQTLGRIHRADGKTPAIQKFVFCAGTLEDHICEKLKNKMDNLSMINDGILHPFPDLNKNNQEKEKQKLTEYLDV
jgi:superfamily II DNA or RNA helicase